MQKIAKIGFLTCTDNIFWYDFGELNVKQ